tara:strand:- start:2313 stop:2795 length:483 start_codon:yes stop_codon:yes gene_type:complete
MKLKKNKNFLLVLIPILVLIDQLSKKWALNNIFFNQNYIEVNKFLNFTPVWNKGISFGMFSDFTNVNFFMTIITSIIILIIFFWIIRVKNIILNLSLLLIISGAIGNLIDRLKYQAVVDFIDFHINNFHWPVFNLADSYITLGASMYIFVIFTSQKNNIA